MPVRNRFAELAEEIATWRRDLHANPELGFETRRSAGLIVDLLRDFGCDEVVEEIGGTGVVGLIRGARAAGPVIGLRADMDALPIAEATGVVYASQVDGKMHACGHDGHSAMLLGAAKYLCETRNFDGAVAVIFQPAEEIAKGAAAMIADKVFERFGVMEVYGMHNRPGLAPGAFAIRTGPFFAGADMFEIVITGKGGHAARPHSCIDPVVAAAHIVSAAQTIASRNLNPVEALVVSFTSIRSDTEAYNVIPNYVTMRGTVRCFKPEVRDLAEARLRDIVAHSVALHGAQSEFRWIAGCPAMVNHAAQTEIAAAAAKAVAGHVRTDADLVMGGEDFAFMLDVLPGAYIQVGNGDGPEVHHPQYDFNDEAIPAGCSYWVELVESRLRLNS